MYKFNIEKLQEILSSGGDFAELTKNTLHNYLSYDVNYLATSPQLINFLVEVGVLKEEKNVSRFKFPSGGTKEN